jgi:hypothetical protein
VEGVEFAGLSFEVDTCEEDDDADPRGLRLYETGVAGVLEVEDVRRFLGAGSDAGC